MVLVTSEILILLNSKNMQFLVKQRQVTALCNNWQWQHIYKNVKHICMLACTETQAVTYVGMNGHRHKHTNPVLFF